MSVNSEFEYDLFQEERDFENRDAIQRDLEESARYRRYFYGLFIMCLGFLMMCLSPIEKDLFFYSSAAIVMCGLLVFSTGIVYSPYESKDEYDMSMFVDQLDGDDF